MQAITDRGAKGASPKEKKSSKKDLEFLKQAVKRFNRAESAEAKNRQQAVDDLKFKAGDQWPESIKATRTIEKRPCLTINKMKTFVHQITNDQRQNRPSINVSPVGDKADPETAKMLKGLIKQIERNSNADVAYDTGFDNAVSNGWGYWRILTDYEDEDTFDQVIKIVRIRNPFRVYLDPDHSEPDGSDAKWAFISDLVVRSEFEEQWPQADPMVWSEGGIGDEYKSWNTQTHVRIAEYFYQDTETKRLVQLANGHTGYYDDLAPELQRKVDDDESFVLNDRDVQCKTIKWCKLTAYEVLEENEWVGKWIPIVKCIGDEVDIQGKSELAGLIRDAKDPQRMINYWETAFTEMVALAPKAPWILEEGQIEGHEGRWKEANVKSFPYLTYKGVNINGKPAPPPQRQPFPGPAAGHVQAIQMAQQDMQAVTGVRFDATLQERTYDESGKALRELKRVGDLGNFHYVDNLARSLRHTGNILIDLIPKIYDTPRVLTILREDGGEERVKIDPTLGKPHDRQQLADGRTERLYNPKLGDYAVAVTIGPSFATKRAEASDSMIAFLKVLPQTGPLIGDLIAKNQDWPGADEIAARLQSTLPPQMLNKNLDQLPPEAKGTIMNLQQQLQKAEQEKKQALVLLGDKEKDRDIDRQALANEAEKIRKDYDAKIAKVVEDFEKAKLQLAAKLGEQPEMPEDKTPELLLKLHEIETKAQIEIEKLKVKLVEAEMKAEQASEQVKAQKEMQTKDHKNEDRGRQRKEDIEKADAKRTAELERIEAGHQKIMDRVNDQITELKRDMKELQNMEIIFDRDPKSNRITKARKVKPIGKRA